MFLIFNLQIDRKGQVMIHRSLYTVFVFIFLSLNALAQLTARDMHLNNQQPYQNQRKERLHQLRRDSLAQLSQTTQVDSNLTLVGEWAWGACNAAVVQGNLAYIGNGGLFQVLDISTPSSPQIIGQYDIPNGLIQDIKINDSLAYVACLGLTILDISNPRAPTLLGSVSFAGVYKIALQDSFVYAIASNSLRVIDVSNPQSPRLRGRIPTASFLPADIVVKDTLVYVCQYEEPILEIIDVAKPDSIRDDTLIYGIGSTSGFVKDTLLYLDIAGSFQIFSISNPVSPVQLGIDVYDSTGGDIQSTMDVEGNYAYVTGGTTGVHAFDVSNPGAPFIAGNIQYPNDYPSQNSFATSYQGGVLCVANGTGLLIINAANPDSLCQWTFFLTGANGSFDAAIKNNYAFVATGNGGMAVLDISNPASPTRVSNIGVAGSASQVILCGNYAYLGSIGLVNLGGGAYTPADTSTVSVIDISDPSKPHRVSQVSVKGPVQDFAVENDRLYVLAPDTGTYIYNISNPLAPVQLGFTPDGSYSVSVKDSIAYFSGGSGGVIIVDVTDPRHPIELSRLYLGHVDYVLLKDTVAFVDCDSGLTALNISDPSNPKIISSDSSVFQWGPYLLNMSCSGNFLYYSSGVIAVFDVTDPSNLRVVGLNSTTGGMATAESGDYVYCVSGGGFTVLKNSLIASVPKAKNVPNSFRLDQNYPNPFNPTTRLEYSVSLPSNVTIAIYDLLGQKVNTFISRNVLPGEHSINFYGANLPTGVYFYQIMVSSIDNRKTYYTNTKKMILLK
jgi:hypothetical protein